MTNVTKISKVIPKDADEGKDDKKKSTIRLFLAGKECLNSGAYGQVWALTQQDRVLKLYEKGMAIEVYEDHRMEAQLLLHASDPRNGWPPVLVRCFQALQFPENKDWPYGLVLERLGLNLYEYVQTKHKSYKFAQVQKWMYQVFLGLACLHRSGIVHGDLKPGNICLVPGTINDTRIKLIDFGMSHRIGARTGRTLTSLSFRCPERLIAPESTRIDASMDMWSAGCILAFFMDGQENLFTIPETKTLVGDKTKRMHETQEEFETRLEEDYVLTQIKRELRISSTNRKTRLEEFRLRLTDRRFERYPKRKTAWTRMLNLLDKLLVWDPKKRISALDALAHPFFPDSFRTTWPMPTRRQFVKAPNDLGSDSSHDAFCFLPASF